MIRNIVSSGALALMVGSCLLIGCDEDSVEGRVCSSADPCGDGFVCVRAADEVSRCMARCDGLTMCSDGSACLELTSGTQSVCWLGGTTPVGETCEGNLECVRAARCVRFGADDAPVCAPVCDPTDSDTMCGADETCTPLENAGGACHGS